MSDDLDAGVEEDGGDGGGWLATFADLMALLMCFFVLLLSFSEMEIKKYKQVAGSMSEAFGVQRQIKSKEIPKGTSIIAQEFSPGKPTQTFTIVLQQETTDQNKQNLDFSDSEFKGKAEETADPTEKPDQPIEDPTDKPPIDPSILEAAKMIAKALNEEIELGMIEVVATPERVAIRVREKGSFESGSATLSEQFLPVLEKMTETLKVTEGEVVVAGHTDDVPIKTARYPSNWELSSARAAAFVRYMTDEAAFAAERLQIRGFADTRPIVPNDTAENRAVNRRVEVSLVLPTKNVTNVGEMLQKSEPPADMEEMKPEIPEPPARDLTNRAQ
ncbi:MAG: MotB family protein [Pseudomonadota bacterium]